ncbi:YybH family protein [Pectobacterium brasiliense]|uniref:YybH family protein n=1 Tax=Pectobacterium brasiliense TaxID=180957 RepID=UPI00196933FF|nr:SgcJ/EcaC family oxidoreductase [Pectobacterium brasiliense]MBN3263703.1 SgcJ/EcaC family oxidoreductase [Pectobacterium brasiliense]
MSKTLNEELVKIEAVAVAYLTAFNRADIPAVIETYTNDGVLMGPGKPASIGKDELELAYNSVFETIGFSMKYEIKEVEQISPDWAFVRSATEGTETDKATGIVTPAAYQELFLLHKHAAGSWQIARYCTTKISS